MIKGNSDFEVAGGGPVANVRFTSRSTPTTAR